MTSRASADSDRMISLGLKVKKAIERYDAVKLRERDTHESRDSPNLRFREVLMRRLVLKLFQDSQHRPAPSLLGHDQTVNQWRFLRPRGLDFDLLFTESHGKLLSGPGLG